MQKNNLEFNEKIQALQLRLIDEDGSIIGIVTKQEALAIGEEKKKDIVLVAKNSNPPVAKLCEKDKYIYKLMKEEKKKRNNSKKISVKEILVRIRTDKNDIANKMLRAKEFIADGNKVKINMRLKRKEIHMLQNGIDILNNLANELESVAKIESKTVLKEDEKPTNIFILLCPHKK